MSKIKIGDTFFIKLNIEDILHVAYGVWNCKTFNDLTLKSEMFFESLSINNYHYSLLSKIDYDK